MNCIKFNLVVIRSISLPFCRQHFQLRFLAWKSLYFLFKIQSFFVKDLISKPAVVQILAWCLFRAKLSSEPIMIQICDANTITIWTAMMAWCSHAYAPLYMHQWVKYAMHIYVTGPSELNTPYHQVVNQTCSLGASYDCFVTLLRRPPLWWHGFDKVRTSSNVQTCQRVITSMESGQHLIRV